MHSRIFHDGPSITYIIAHVYCIRWVSTCLHVYGQTHLLQFFKNTPKIIVHLITYMAWCTFCIYWTFYRKIVKMCCSLSVLHLRIILECWRIRGTKLISKTHFEKTFSTAISHPYICLFYSNIIVSESKYVRCVISVI